jgi:hypothetical protein
MYLEYDFSRSKLQHMKVSDMNFEYPKTYRLDNMTSKLSDPRRVREKDFPTLKKIRGFCRTEPHDKTKQNLLALRCFH